MAERREVPRIPVEKEVILSLRGRSVPGRVEDLSDIGARLRILADRADAVTDDDLGEDVVFVLDIFTPPREYTGELIRRYFDGGVQHIALRFWRKYRELPKT